LVKDEEIVEWAKKHPIYCKYLANLDALRVLYQKQVLGEMAGAVGGRGYKQISIKDLTVGQRVCVKGIIVEKRTRTYEGCEICRKKECEHNVGRKEYVITMLLIADVTGSVWGTFMGSIDEISDGDEVECYGRTKRFGENVEINIDKVEKLMSCVDNKEQVLKFIGKAGSMKKVVVEQLCKRFGVDWSSIEGSVVIDGEYVKLRV